MNNKLSKEEKALLSVSLKKLAEVQKKKKNYRYASETDQERQFEFYRLVNDAYGLQNDEECVNCSGILKNNISIIGAEQIAKICKEYLYFVFGDTTFDENFPEVFDIIPVSRESMKKIDDEVFEEFKKGCESVIKKYENKEYSEQNE